MEQYYGWNIGKRRAAEVRLFAGCRQQAELSICVLYLKEKGDQFAMCLFKVLGGRLFLVTNVTLWISGVSGKACPPVPVEAARVLFENVIYSGLGEPAQQQDGCPHRGLGFISQHPHGSSQWSVTPFPRDPVSFFGLFRYQACKWYTHMHMKLNF